MPSGYEESMQAPRPNDCRIHDPEVCELVVNAQATVDTLGDAISELEKVTDRLRVTKTTRRLIAL